MVQIGAIEGVDEADDMEGEEDTLEEELEEELVSNDEDEGGANVDDRVGICELVEGGAWVGVEDGLSEELTAGVGDVRALSRPARFVNNTHS